MIENIVQMNNGYIATIGGVEWFVFNSPTDANWQTVQDAISNGASVTVQVPFANRVPNLTFAQLMIGLVTEAWITEAEGEAWLIGTLPPAVLAVINALPESQRFAAKARALCPSEVLRADPLVISMGAAAGKTEAEIDTFFRTYAVI